MQVGTTAAANSHRYQENWGKTKRFLPKVSYQKIPNLPPKKWTKRCGDIYWSDLQQDSRSLFGSNPSKVYHRCVKLSRWITAGLAVALNSRIGPWIFVDFWTSNIRSGFIQKKAHWKVEDHGWEDGKIHPRSYPDHPEASEIQTKKDRGFLQKTRLWQVYCLFPSQARKDSPAQSSGRFTKTGGSVTTLIEFWKLRTPLGFMILLKQPLLGGGFKYFFFEPLPGETIRFDESFQMGWNHQPD